jgi:hypothetical protein
VTRSSWLGVIGSAKAWPGWPSRRHGPGAPAAYRDSPAQRTVSRHEIHLDDDFRDLLANALIARRRAQIPDAPELMLVRETWAADGWAGAEADQLIAHIRAATEYRMVCHEQDGQRILKAAVT